MYCYKCGKENKDDSKFCNNCGANIDRDNGKDKAADTELSHDTITAQENSIHNIETNKTPRKKSKGVKIAVFAILVFIAGSFAYYLYSEYSAGSDISSVEYITRDQINQIDEGMSFTDFTTLVGGTGNLVFNRSGVKTYEFKIKEQPDTAIRVAFDENGDLLAIADNNDNPITLGEDASSPDIETASAVGEDTEFSKTEFNPAVYTGVIENCKASKHSDAESFCFQDVVDYFFQEPLWDSYSKNGIVYVSVSGNILFEEDADCNVKFVQSFDVDTYEFEPYELYINDEKQSEQSIKNFYTDMISKYASDNGAFLGD